METADFGDVPPGEATLAYAGASDLASGVYLYRFAQGERVETGTFYMNRCDYCDPALPWTGVKDTGRGCSLSKYGFHQITRLKSMHLRTEL